MTIIESRKTIILRSYYSFQFTSLAKSFYVFCICLREYKSGVLSIKLLKSNATRLLKTTLCVQWTLTLPFNALCKMDVAFKAYCCVYDCIFPLYEREPKAYRYMKTF